MPNGLITLTTDFGLADHFVGTMKGVILGIAPKTRIVDITHDIPAYELREASFAIAQAWQYFPKGTVHVVIVDPGVGTSRHPILAEAGGHYFIAPDNGVLSMVYESVAHKVRIISNPALIRKQVSRTFHGRDVFAPAAAHLAKGVPPAKFGKIVRDYVRSWLFKPVQANGHSWTGSVLKVDRFGNLITNLHIDSLADIKTRPFELRIGAEKIRRLALTYAEVDIGDLFAVVGSSGYIEVAANQTSAAGRLGCGSGAPVELEIYFESRGESRG